MNRIARPGFTRVDLTASLFIIVAALCVLLPACSKSRTSELETESKNNLKDIGDANTKRDDRGDPNPIRAAAGRSHSTNNLKQIGISMHSMAISNNGALPPSIGPYPSGHTINASIFFQMLPYLEQDNVYKQYMKDPSACNAVIQTYIAPLDSSNDGKQPLTSYASNAAVFGTDGKFPVRYPAAFHAKGTSNTIPFMERFAVTEIDGKTNTHLWSAINPAHVNYLFDVAVPAPLINLPDPIFGAAPKTVRNDDTAHAFSGNTLLVGLGDGSARAIKPDITAKNVISEGGPSPIAKGTISVWTWACLFNGPVGFAPTPAGW
jgi:hypothetical protein